MGASQGMDPRKDIDRTTVDHNMMITTPNREPGPKIGGSSCVERAVFDELSSLVACPS